MIRTVMKTAIQQLDLGKYLCYLWQVKMEVLV